MGGCSFFGFRDDGSRFLLMNIFGGGWGGRPHEDGEYAAVSVCQGDVRNTPVELQEIKYPLLVETHALRADSGGAGQVSRRARRRADLSAAAEVQGQHQSRPHPRSALGPARRQARRGQRAALIRRADGSEQRVKKATEVEIAAGDRRHLPHRRRRRLRRSAPSARAPRPNAALRSSPARRRHAGRSKIMIARTSGMQAPHRRDAGGGRPRRAAGLRQRLAGRLPALRHRFRHPRRPGARDRARRRPHHALSRQRAGGRPRRARLPRHRGACIAPDLARRGRRRRSTACATSASARRRSGCCRAGSRRAPSDLQAQRRNRASSTAC